MPATLNQMKCNGHLPRFAVVLLAVATVAAPRVLADPLGANGGAVFRLDAESAFQRGCFPPCLCPIMHIDDLKGTMELIYTGFDGLVETYRVVDVNWAVAGPDGSLRVTGVGRYSIGSPNPQLVIEHRMELDLVIGDEPVQHFDSGWIPVEHFGGIHITVSMNGMYCFDTVFIIHASRVPDNEIVPYALGAGSTFQRGCWDPCDCLLGPELPMIGTFALVPMQNDTTLGAEFAVVRINWNVLTTNVADGVPIKGAGKYRVEPDIMRQEMGLSLIIGDEPRARFGSGDVPLGVPPLAIDIVVSVNGMVCYDTVLHIVAAPVDTQVCGGIAGIPCDDGEFCKLPIGACCCDHMGVCMPIPTDCPAVWAPVCGCDGVTYGNECEADKAGVTIRHLGECETVCGGWAGDTCEEGEFCKFLTGVCNDWADASGVCTPIPDACPEIYDPVCGCDGVTYDNECFADAASMSILHHGPCVPIGACCLDMNDGPIAYDTCLPMSEDDCKKKGGIFAGSNAACEATEACCFTFASVEGCADLHPFCCLASGGIPQGPGSTCHPVPQSCGGIANIPCPVGFVCVDDPGDNCDPDTGGLDCPGICVLDQQVCGGIANLPCPDGYMCIDDPTDNCDPNAGGADCPGICVPEPPCHEVCGGIQGIPCTDPNEFCKLPTGHCCCDHLGLCMPMPIGCPDVWKPVCGCDGQTYGNECEADAVGVSIDYYGECEVCHVSPDGSSCQPLACSAIPEDQCIPGVIHLDISTGALTVDDCRCMDFNLCHIEFGDASPFAVGHCPDGGSCEVIAEDTDGDGIPDTFRAECVRVGACCSDMGGSPLPVPVCKDRVPEDQCLSGLFKGPGTTCEPEACCLTDPAGTPLSTCMNLDPFCCRSFGGVPQGAGTTCNDPNISCPQICGGIQGIPCHDPDQFCKTAPGQCCCDHFGVCTPIPDACPENIDPVCGCDGVTYTNECHADMAGVSVDHPGPCEIPPCVATRRFVSTDLSFCPGDLLRVVIELAPPAGASAIALEDQPPPGWVVTQVSDGGFYDATSGKVKWGPMFQPFPQTVWYETVPSVDNSQTRCFVGTVSVDGENQAICGDACLAVCCPRMAADLPHGGCPDCPIRDCTECDADRCANGRISPCELIGYACAWLRGCHDDIAGMTRAAYIWRNGECNCWDDGGSNWFPTDCPAPNTGCCSGPIARSTDGPGTEGATVNLSRALRGRTARDTSTTVSVDINPPAGTTALSIEIAVPRGWRVGTVSDGGRWDEQNRKVKWGPLYEDHGRTLTFEVQTGGIRLTKRPRGALRETKAQSLHGTVSFDGLNQPVTVE